MDILHASVSNIINDIKWMQTDCLRIIIEDNGLTSFTSKAVHIIRNIKMEIRLIFKYSIGTTSVVLQLEEAIAKIRSVLNGSENGCIDYNSSASSEEMSLLHFCNYSLSIAIDALLSLKLILTATVFN